MPTPQQQYLNIYFSMLAVTWYLISRRVLRSWIQTIILVTLDTAFPSCLFLRTPASLTHECKGVRDTVSGPCKFAPTLCRHYARYPWHVLDTDFSLDNHIATVCWAWSDIVLLVSAHCSLCLPVQIPCTSAGTVM
jgi:hypothetical protein